MSTVLLMACNWWRVPTKNRPFTAMLIICARGTGLIRAVPDTTLVQHCPQVTQRPCMWLWQALSWSCFTVISGSTWIFLSNFQQALARSHATPGIVWKFGASLIEFALYTPTSLTWVFILPLHVTIAATSPNSISTSEDATENHRKRRSKIPA